MKYYQGYTLIELLVTIALLAIMAAIVVPQVKPIMAGLEMSSAARQLYADLHYAKVVAMEQQKYCCLSVNTTSGWAVVEDTDNNNQCDATDTRLKTFSLPVNYPDITFDNTVTNSTIQFDHIGLASNANTLKLINSKYNKDANVTVSVAGYISID